uniref:Putative secreted protein n=1 Tax=Rhipicephalus microplus TaxID=6941 RepID=A0A6G5A2P2_RHIMP
MLSYLSFLAAYATVFTAQCNTSCSYLPSRVLRLDPRRVRRVLFTRGSDLIAFCLERPFAALAPGNPKAIAEEDSVPSFLWRESVNTATKATMTKQVVFFIINELECSLLNDYCQT